jgi:hypothetical protein
LPSFFFLLSPAPTLIGYDSMTYAALVVPPPSARAAAYYFSLFSLTFWAREMKAF